MARTRWKSLGNTSVSYGSSRGGREGEARTQHPGEGGRWKQGSPVHGGGQNIDLWGGLRGWCPRALHPRPPTLPIPTSLSHQSTRPVAEPVVGRTLVAWWSSPQLPAKSWWDWRWAVGVARRKGWWMHRVVEGRLYSSRKAFLASISRR